MGLRITEPPTAEPVSVADVKTRLRIDHDAEDALLARLAIAAREAVEAYAGRALITRRVTEALNAWPSGGVVSLSLAPILSLLAVRVIDASGASVALPSETYAVETDRDQTRVAFLSAPPAPGRRVGGIELDYRAGYGGEAAAVPPALREAVLVTALALYAAGEGPRAFPDTARALAMPFIRVRT